MSIVIASLYSNGYIDVLYDMMTQKIVYEPHATHEPCALMNTYTKIFDVPNINFPLYELGSIYVILQCCIVRTDIITNDTTGLFNNINREGCCILKTCKGNIKSLIHTLRCKPYSEMTQMTCDDLDAWFLKMAQHSIKKIDSFNQFH